MDDFEERLLASGLATFSSYGLLVRRLVGWLGFTSTVLSIYLPVTYEGFGLPFCEGMALELAQLCSKQYVHARIVGDAGIPAPPDDLERWVTL